MAPNTEGTTTMASRRQSCDRCHGQKLRCTRTGGNNTGACNRCLRQGAQCVYSFSLPKGRPSMYRMTETARDNSNPPATSVKSITPPGSPEDQPQRQISPEATNDDAKANDNKSNGTVEASTNSNISVTASIDIEKNIHTSISEDPILSSPAIRSTPASWSLPSSMCPWLEPFSWDDMQIDMQESETAQPQPCWNFYAKGNAQHDVHTILHDEFPYIPPWGSIGNSEPGVRRSSSVSSFLHEHNQGPDAGIAQLSQLSTRLYPLHRASCTLADAIGASSQSRDHNTGRPGPLIDDTAFKSIATWLVHVSANMNLFLAPERQNSGLGPANLGDTLLDAFSTSRHLLDILRCLQNNVGHWNAMTPQATPAMNPFDVDQIGGLSSSPSRPPSQYSSTVIRHLVIACHTLILSIYVAVLTALQHDVDLRNSSEAANGSVDTDRMDAVGLADMQLAMTVQLCSYLIERQCEAVHSYLSPKTSPQSFDATSSQHAAAPSPVPNSREAMKELEAEVQQRITMMRKTLRI